MRESENVAYKFIYAVLIVISVWVKCQTSLHDLRITFPRPFHFSTAFFIRTRAELMNRSFLFLIIVAAEEYHEMEELLNSVTSIIEQKKTKQKLSTN